ncbi:MAG TPA: hypothetical protein VFQ44_05045 [Streptosporangiaceae bacterium]|nr:hypothetical protein [Streptosporangiaceae bacterium]
MTRTRTSQRILRSGVVAAAIGAGLAASANAQVSASTAAAANAPAASFIFRKLNNSSDPTFNQLLGINNHGRIVGYFGSGAHGHPNKGYQLVAPYHQANYKAENFPRSAQTEVTSLNDQGTTVGFFSMSNKVNPFANGFTGFYLKGGKYHRVAFPAASRSNPPVNELLGINNAGVAVGFYLDALGNAHSYRFSTATHKFARINVHGSANVTATAINAGGSIVGFFTNGAGQVNSFLRRASGKMTVFGKPGADLTQAFGINKAGEVVGAYTIGNSTFGFIWRAGHGFRTVNDPNGHGSTIINGINNSGELVGFYTDAKGNTDGMLAIP